MLLLFSCCSSADKPTASITLCNIRSADRGRNFGSMGDKAAGCTQHCASDARRPRVSAPRAVVRLTPLSRLEKDNSL